MNTQRSASPSESLISAESRVAAGEGRDRIAQMETRGVDYIPPVERNSRPANLAWTFFGVQFGYTIFVLGGLLPVFGLSWWPSFWAVITGSVIGSVAVAATALIGPKSGTNSTVSSVASFGIRGRYLGSIIAQFDNLGFNVIVIWTGGLGLVATMHRLAGTGTGTGPLVLGMAIVAVGMSVFGLLGHATLVAGYKFVAVSSVIAIGIFMVVNAHHFHAQLPHGSAYALGSFWPTWLLGVTLALVNPISYGVGINDYARRIPEDASPRRLVTALAGGMFSGNALACLVGVFVTLSLTSVDTPLVSGMIQLTPGWFLIPFALTGFVSSIAGGGIDMYNATLDLHAILFKLSRPANAAIIIVVTFVVTYLAVVVYNATTTITSFATVLSVLLGPWIAILIVRHFELGTRYHVLDLHAYAGEHKGAYWYSAGFGARAMIVWAVSTAVGLLWSSTTLYVGPLTHVSDGIDLSFIVAFVLGGVLYYAWGTLAPLASERVAPAVAPVMVTESR
ncbi:MAG: purine-cytosine permease family protein [Streptosporangiaceae bacterium]